MARFEQAAITPSRRWQRCVDQRGITMAAVLLLLLLMATLGTATMQLTLVDYKATQHYATGNQAFASAEAGLLDVLSTINARGILSFKIDVVDSHMITTGVTYALPGNPAARYRVDSVTNGTDQALDGMVKVTGFGGLQAERELVVNLKRAGFGFGPGALHLSNDTAYGSFSGASFTVTGNNRRANGTFDPTIPARPGISVRNDTVRDSVKSVLTTSQKTNVTGLTFTTQPLNPSVVTTNAASNDDITRMVAEILGKNGVNRPSTENPINQNNNLGTALNPVVTEIGVGSKNSAPRIAGGAIGYGILIIDGDIQFQGNFDFYGWVLFRNPSAGGIGVGGNVTLNGSTWTPLPNFSGNGSIQLNYCHECLELYADDSGNGDNFPRPVLVSEWGG